MVNVISVSADDISVDKNEVLRYLGCNNPDLSSEGFKYIDSYIVEFKKIISPKVCYSKFEIVSIKNELVHFDCFKFSSALLSKKLENCIHAYFFAATVGLDVDRIIQKYAQISPTKAVIFDAIGSVTIESFCDLICNKLSKMEQENNMFLHKRFSPGYGDFDLSYQEDLFNLLDCRKNIGLTLTDSYMMVPIKSVTGIIGASQYDDCKDVKCEDCQKLDCAYRRK